MTVIINEFGGNKERKKGKDLWNGQVKNKKWLCLMRE
jgi:hypothetical protein